MHTLSLTPATVLSAAAGNSWCWCQRGMFMTLPTYFRQHGYTTAGGGKLFVSTPALFLSD